MKTVPSFSLLAALVIGIMPSGQVAALAPSDTLTLSSFVVEYGAPSATQVGRLGVSGGSSAGVTFSLVSGAGATDNSSFVVTDTDLKTSPGLLLLPGASASIRVRATEGAVQVEQVFTLTIQQGPPNTMLMPLPPQMGNPSGSLGYSVAVGATFSVLATEVNPAHEAVKGAIKVFNNATGALLHIIDNPDSANVQYFGGQMDASGSLLAVSGTSSNRVFVYDMSSATPTVPAFVLTPSLGISALAISGSRIVIGSKDVHHGQAVVYDLNSATPTTPVLTLNTPQPNTHDYFGTSVDIDGTRFVVGAPRNNPGADDRGTVRVYDLASATPSTPLFTIIDPTPESGFSVSGPDGDDDMFGRVVAIANNRVYGGGGAEHSVYDISGASAVFMGRPAKDNLHGNGVQRAHAFTLGVTMSGSRLAIGMYENEIITRVADYFLVYDLASATPMTPALVPDDLRLGNTVDKGMISLSGSTLLIGDRYDSEFGEGAGAGRLFDLTSATPGTPVRKLHHETTGMNDNFGGRTDSRIDGMAMSGSRMVVAAPGAGLAYVYDFSTAVPSQPVLTLQPPSWPMVRGITGGGTSTFGVTVAIDGTRVAVGSDETTSAHSGSYVYIFDATDSQPALPRQTLEMPAGFTVKTVAVSGSRVAVGDMETANLSGIGAGSVRLYDLSSATPTVPVAVLYCPDSSSNPRFGASLAMSATRLVVGDPLGGTVVTSPPGRVYVYDWSGATPVLQHSLNNPAPGPGLDNFGINVAISGSRVLVGAPNEFTAPSIGGAVYVYDLSGATPTVPLLSVPSPSGVSSDNFGWSVAMDGNSFIVGCVPSNGNRPGRAFVFDLTSATPASPVATLIDPQHTIGINDYFGRSVAISGALAAVAAPASNIVAPDKGYAWLYGPAPANTAPVLTLNGANPLTYEARATYVDAGATATDAEDGTLTPVITSNTVVPTVAGTYSVTWSAIDTPGLIATRTRTVTVIPSSPPSLSAPMGGFVPLTLREGTALPDYASSAVASDNSGSVTVTQSIAPGTLLAPGTHTITLTATDAAGNATTLDVVVTVTALPETGVFSGDFPLNPKNMWWHNEFTAHPTNGWLYGGCARGGQFNCGMIFRVNAAGDYETLVHFTNNGLRNKGMGPGGRLTLGTDGLFYGTTGEGGANGKGTIFKMTPEGELTTLVHFTGTTGAVLGAEPTGGVIQGLDGNFYGTTQDGGTANFGTAFKITPAGVFTSLVSFTDLSGPNLGSFPNASLAQDADGNLYGTTAWGGANGKGTLFKVTTTGTFTSLVSFTGTSGGARGQNPNGSLTRAADGSFYGMTTAGGANSVGTIFKVTSAGVLTTLIDFISNGTSNKGAYPYADLTLGNDGNFYGMTSEGGVTNKGTIFKLTPGGTFTTLVNFTGNGITNKGAYPKGTLGLGLDGNFYGMTQNGGAQDAGTVFKVTPAGVLTTLLESTTFNNGVTEKGGYLQGGLCAAPDGTLWGTTFFGGDQNLGTIFKLDAYGNRTTVIHFTGTSGANRGSNPPSGLVLGSDGNFYGVTQNGGSNGFGTVFRLTPAGTLTTLVDFTNNGASNKGKHPYGRLEEGPDGRLYGMVNEGGDNNLGTIFRMTKAGELTTLLHLSADPGAIGYWPVGHFTLASDGKLYALMNSGGTNDHGTIFRLVLSGESFSFERLVSFNLNGPTNGVRGGWPWGNLTEGPGGVLYGMTNSGAAGFGTIFQVTTSGVFTHLHDFTGMGGATPGAYPLGDLIYAPDGFLYGAANSGGTHDRGTLFKMTTSGTVATLVNFKGEGTGIESGAWPYLDEFTIGADGQLYGMTNVGGRQGGGMVYRIEMPAPEIAVSGNGIDIINNDATPSASDHTHFGQAPVASGSVVRSFTIANTGETDLTLGTVSITGPNAGEFSISAAPASIITSGNSTTLAITFDPSAAGARTAQVSFATNDFTENPFTFAISGIGNSPPAFAGMTINTVQGKVTDIAEAKLLLRGSDDDGNSLSITGFSATSAQGAIITRGGGFITWAPSPLFTGTDTFTITLSDGMSSTLGTVTMNVSADPGLNPSSPPLLTPQAGGAMRLGFKGIPGRVYGIQRSTDLVNWTQIATPAASSTGDVTVDDSPPPGGSAFYRIIFPAH